MGGGHFRVESNRAEEFTFGLFPAFQSGIRITKLKMCVGFAGAFGDEFLKRVQGGREITPVDGLCRSRKKRSERIFFWRRRGLWRRLHGRFALRLRGEGIPHQGGSGEGVSGSK